MTAVFPISRDDSWFFLLHWEILHAGKWTAHIETTVRLILGSPLALEFASFVDQSEYERC